MATRKHRQFPEKRRQLITQLKRFDYGREQISRLIAPLSFIIAIFTLLKVYNISFTSTQILLASLAAVLVMFVIGFVWDNLGMVEEEIEYANERNRFVKAMLKHAWLNKLRGAKINKK